MLSMTNMTNTHNMQQSNESAVSQTIEYAHSTTSTDTELFVYCSKNDEERLHNVLKTNGINYRLNDYSIRPKRGKTICHYKHWSMEPQAQEFLIRMMERGVWVEPLISYLDRRLGLTEVDLLHSGYFLHQKAFSILTHSKNRLFKRMLDLLFVFILSLVAIPVGLITALLIKLESPGPIFFRQQRTGLHNCEFDVIKFRSMRSDAEKHGAQWASKNDSRVTRIGKFIRKTRIDELPQLINVLKGEMSMVGPRPEREIFIDELEKIIPYYRFRHSVKPGITGLAQVKYSYGASVGDAVWKHKYDIYYIKHQSFRMDLKILGLTVKTVLFGMGR